MDRSDIPIMMILVLAAVVFGAVCACIIVPPHTSHATSEETPLVETPTPNQIFGLDVSMSDYQVFINYTPERGAKVMRVEYIEWYYGASKTAYAPFDFQLNGERPVSTTFQKRDMVGNMRVTIIYDNNIVKYVEFQT